MNLAATCVKRPVFAVMLIGFLVVLGLFSFRDLGVDLFPKADPATVNINARLPGASSEEVTTQVVIPIEEALSTISGLDEITVMTFESTARITVRFVLERDIESAAQDVREKISGAMRNLPPNLLPLVIQKADPDADPVLSIVVAGGTSLRETSELAEKRVKRALETVEGVGGVSLIGSRERQVRIFVDADKLNAHGITIDAFQRAVQNENVEVPGGRIIRGEAELGVRTLGRISAVSQFADIIVSNVNGTPIRVSDLGRVEDTFAEPRTWNMLDDKEAVTLEVRRQSGTNTVQVIEEVKQELARLRQALPPGIDLRITKDQSVFINASVLALQEHLLLGSLLASLIVWVFIRSTRSVFIAALAIPTSIIATFTLMKAFGFTLNNMTLLALTLAVGIVIDDAIVVLENIVRYIEDKKIEPRRAAIEATAEISLAVLATTVSLIIIFVPIAFITGYARRYLNEFGWTMACAVAVSMLVSFTLTPMMSSRMLRRIERKRAAGAGPEEEPVASASHHAPATGFYGRVERAYGELLSWSLDHRGAVLAVGLLAFALTFPLNRLVGRDWIPLDDQGEVELSYNMPEGTSIYGTAKVSAELAQKFRKIEGVAFVRPYIHDGQMSHSHVYLKLTDFGERSATVHDVANDIRRIIVDYPNVRGRIIFPSALGGGEMFYPIRAQILGPDFPSVAEIAKRVADRSRNIPGLYDVDAGLSLNSPELQVRIDRQRAADLGIRAADIANAIRLMIAGEDQISTYKEGDEQYPVTMQLLPEQQKNPEILARLMIPSATQGQVRLDSLASIERGYGPARIERFNRQFAVSVNANIAPDFPLDAAAAGVTGVIRDVGLPAGYGYRFGGSVQYLDQTTASLIVAFLLAAIFMYMVLAAQFESFVHPFVIMLSLPLAVPFALLTLWLTGRTLNLWSVLGVLLLLGIVKKNGILQVDYTNTLLSQGVPLREAILEANRVRLRPILMTTFAIVAGLLPTAVGLGAGSSQRSAVAITIIGGQMLCLVLTLLMTPVAYSIAAETDARAWLRSLRPARWRGAGTPS